ncbi:MAG: hypothetical protein WED33_05540, partial [Bacteroidia bacterium]
SSTLMNIPDWFRKGLVSYMSRPWSTDSDSWLKDGILSGRYYKFNRIQGEDALVAGESIWHYIANTYGERVIGDILEMTRITRSIDNGFQFVLGLDLKGLTQEWINYYDKKYYTSRNLFVDLPGEKLSKKNRRNLLFLHPKLSPSGKYLSYVSNEAGKSIIRIADTQNPKTKFKIKMGRRLPNINDTSFPVTGWHPNNSLFLYTDEFKGRLRLNFFDLESGETERKFIDDVQKIIHFDIAPNGRDFAVTALKDGKVDLLIFNNIANTFMTVSNDHWDEGEAVWTTDGKSIVFSSNRPKDSLEIAGKIPLIPSSNHDLFQVNVDDLSLKQLTKSGSVNERKPRITGARTLAYLSNANGLSNIYTASFDSSVVAVDTIVHYNYFLNSSALSNANNAVQDFDIQGEKVLSTSVKSFKNQLLLSNADQLRKTFQEELPHASWSPAKSILPAPKLPETRNSESKKAKTKVRRIVVFGKGEEEETPVEKTDLADTSKFQLSRQRIYETSYYPEYLVTRIDRSFLNQTYQPYSPDGYFNPSVNGLFRFATSDLFEDYRLTGGIRLAGNLTGNEYLLSFESLKNRLDHSFIFHRQGIQAGIQAGTRVMLHTATAKVSFPFNEVARIDGSVAYRNDRTVYLSTDLANLNRPNEFRHWTQAKAEFVWDNSFPIGLNMFTGMRAKATLEHFRRLDERGINVTIAGFDVRNYGRVMREMIWATRVAGATSFGPNKLLFYLGGVDNWFIPRFDNSVNVDQSQNYIFQTLGTNVRGFFQNIRNGSSFAVVNTELRWNFMKFFSKYPLRSDFFNSMQAIGFADAGTAFTGSSPYSEDNTFNQQTITSGPITVILKNQREPIVAGLGFGIRTRILGYFVRVDYARGIEDGSLLPAIIYLSLGADF